MACEAKALQHSLPNEALSISRAGFGREFDERIALPNGRDAPIDLGSAANAFSSCARPLAIGPMQKWIHGLS